MKTRSGFIILNYPPPSVRPQATGGAGERAACSGRRVWAYAYTGGILDCDKTHCVHTRAQ